jgi:hypothetical protein
MSKYFVIFAIVVLVDGFFANVVFNWDISIYRVLFGAFIATAIIGTWRRWK